MGFIFELKDQFWSKPKHPTHICPNCLGLYERSQSEVEETCGYCDSELTTMSFLESLEVFLARVPLENLKKHQAKLQQSLKESKGEKARLMRVDLRQIKRIISFKQDWLRKQLPENEV